MSKARAKSFRSKDGHRLFKVERGRRRNPSTVGSFSSDPVSFRRIMGQAG